MISIIIPLFNKERIVEKTLKSVLSQDYNDYELIVVNDGSTDKSVEVVESLHDPRITLIEQENGGPSKARNTGVKNAKGEWIVFLDADDELVDGALTKMMMEVDRYPDADIIDFGGYIREGNVKRLRYHPLVGKVKKTLKAFFYREISPGCGHSIFRAEIVKRNPYNEKLRRYEDCEILLRILPKSNVYSSQYATEIHDLNYAEASNARIDIREDFTGHLDLKGGGFWYKMCIYQLFLSERENYESQCRKLYPSWYVRYDLLILYKLLNLFR